MLASYYRRFIPRFSDKAAPLRDISKKDQPFYWKEDQQKSFELLKKALTEAPVLVRPDFNKPFILATDASALGLGSILSQQDDHKREHVIEYASKATNESQANYGATKLECLAVVWAVDHFCHYLLGKRFALITDHQALQWLFKKPEPSGIFARWIMSLQEYQFTIVYKKGTKNSNVNTLSRIPQTQ